jgi:hypothetical protein
MEQWKDIVGYEGLYRVSNTGRVLSLGNDKTRQDKILKPDISKGYKRVRLFKNNRSQRYAVHRLVAFAFLPPPVKPTASEVNHINRDRGDNNSYNLEWTTREENMEHANNSDILKEKRKQTKISHIRYLMFKHNITKDEI